MLARIEAKAPWIAYLYAIGNTISMVFLQMCMRVLHEYTHPLYAIKFSSVIIYCITAYLVVSGGEPIDVRDRKTLLLLVVRSFLSTTTLIILLWSVIYLPISIVSSIYNIAPLNIFFVEALHTGKKISFGHLGFTFVSFVGVLLIIKPDFLFSTKERQYQVIYCLLPFIASITVSYGVFFVNNLKGRASASVILHHYYIVQTLVTGFETNLVDSSMKKPFCLTFIALLLLASMISYFSQATLTKANLLKKASYIMPFGYVGMIFSYLVDTLYYGTSFDILSVIGMFLTSSGLLMKLILEFK